jgi:ammonia channel protein AmtB
MKPKPLATVLFVFFSILTLVGSTYASMVFGPKNFTINRWHYHFSYHSFAVDTSGNPLLLGTSSTLQALLTALLNGKKDNEKPQNSEQHNVIYQLRSGLDDRDSWSFGVHSNFYFPTSVILVQDIIQY